MAKKCPNCGSREITFFAGGEAGQIYECKSCGYRGALVVESGSVGSGVKKDLKQLKREMSSHI